MRDHDLIRCYFNGSALVPDGNFATAALNDRLGAGEVVFVDLDPERSAKSHKHAFAFVRTAWLNLPDQLKDAPYAGSPDHLRKHALIATGFRNVEMMPCDTAARAECAAQMMGRIARNLDGYAVTVVDGRVAYCLTAESQSLKAMGGRRFQDSKQAILDWLADLLGVAPDDLARMGRKEAA
ncbi:hypothetical protein [Salipiger marinus]|uniref:hypothetical protein n=1 Tax=Salipiger marinus TaxID=555512 RepID=UPI004057DD69